MPVGLAARAPAALLVFLAAAAALGAAVGGANAAGEADLPASFTLPAPRVGDRASYDATIAGDWGPGLDGGKPFRLTDFEWVAGGRHRAGDLAFRQTDALLVGGWRHDPGRMEWGLGFEPEPAPWWHANTTYLFARGEPWLVMETQGGRIDETFGGPGAVPGVPVGSSSARCKVNVTQSHYFAPGTTRHCLAGPWTGDIGAGMPYQVPSCVAGALPDLGGEYRFVAAEEVMGVPAARLRRAADGNATDLWLSPAAPYPLRVAVRLADGRSLAADLAGFEPGDAARGPAEPAQEPFAFRTAPLTPWSLDDAGAGLPFPLSEAFARVRDHPADNRMRAFLAAHPDAYATQVAYHGEDRSGSFVTRAWSFTVADGPSAMHATVEQSFGPPGSFPAPTLPAGEPAYTYRTTMGPAQVEATPPRWAVPHLPTLASALDAWRLVADPDAAQRGGAAFLDVGCADPACTKAEVTLAAGELSFAHSGLADLSSPEAAGLREGWQVLASLATFGFRDGAWQLARLDDHVYGNDQATTLGGAAAMPRSGGGASIRPVATAASAGLAWLPTPTQAAGVGAVAALVAVAYWLWPAAKSLPALGLFTRLRADRLLDQPQRRLLMDLAEAEPGIHFQELGRRTGLANGVLVHHLRKMVEGGLLVARASGRYTCYFPRGTERSRMDGAPVLKAEGARQVLAAVAAQPGLSSQEVAAVTGLQPSTVSYHVQRLASAGLLHGNRDGRHVRLWPAEAARAP